MFRSNFFATNESCIYHKEVGGATDGEWTYYLEGLPNIMIKGMIYPNAKVTAVLCIGGVIKYQL